jgi:hypothetical protein
VKSLVPLCALVLGLGLACAGGSGDVATDEAAPTTTTPEPAPTAAPTTPAPAATDAPQDVVVVPVTEGTGGPNWCCEYSEGGVTRFALTGGKADCESEFGDRSGRWVDGAQCIPCCCKSPNDEGNLDLGYTYELTTPSSCAGSGTCVADTEATCKGGKTTAAPRPTPRPGPGISGSRDPAPAPAPQPTKTKSKNKAISGER